MSSKQLNMSEKSYTSSTNSSSNSSSSNSFNTVDATHTPRSSRSTPPQEVKDIRAHTALTTQPPATARVDTEGLSEEKFKEIKSKLERLAQGIDREGLDCLLSLQQYRTLLDTLDNLPSDDIVKGFWEEKARYEYDSETQLFRVLMVAGTIHEGFLGAISEEINEYLSGIRKSGRGLVSNFALAITPRCSQPIHYLLDKNPKYDAKPSSNASTSSDVDPLPSLSGRYALRNRTNQNVNEAIAHDSSVESESTSSASSIIEKEYSPDTSWMFRSSQAKDKRPAFIVEVTDTQKRQDLDQKLKSYLTQCDIQSVLICQLANYNEKGACIELWGPKYQSGSNCEEIIGHHRRWRVDILDNEGKIAGQQNDEARIALYDFLTRDTLSRYFSKEADVENAFGQLASKKLLLDTVKLGRKLIDLRNEEQETKQMKSKKRKSAASKGAPQDAAAKRARVRLDAMIENDS